jgi:hypothetical protein
MWIVPLLLLGLVVYAISGGNLVNAIKPAAIPSIRNKPAQNDWKFVRIAATL